MMAVHHNAMRPAAYLTNNASITSEDDDRSVCGVVYVAADAEVGAWQLKPSHSSSSESAAIRPFAHPAAPPGRNNCRNKKTWIYTALGCAVLLAAIIAIAVGSRRQRPAAPANPPTPDSTTGQAAESTPAVLIVPYSVRVAVVPPAGANYYNCDHMFSTDQVISRYTTKLKAALAAQLPLPGNASIHVANITCDGVMYHSANNEAAMDHVSGPGRHLQMSDSSSVFLNLVTDIEVWLHDQVNSPPVSKETAWMTAVRGAATEISQSVISQVLADVFGATVVSSSIQVVQLPAIIISSCSTVAGDAAGQAVVTRATTDPVTGEIVSRQTIQLPIHPAIDTSNDTNQPDGDKGTTAAPATCPHGCSLSNAVSQCISGLCVITRCQPGWEDCDSRADNGCEVSVLGYFTDSAHCGGCGKVCLAPLTCIGGACALPASSSSPSQTHVVPPPGSSSSGNSSSGNSSSGNGSSGNSSSGNSSSGNSSSGNSSSGNSSSGNSSSGNSSSSETDTAAPPTPPGDQQQPQPPKQPVDDPPSSPAVPKPQPDDDDNDGVATNPKPDDPVATPPTSDGLPQPEPDVQAEVPATPVVYDDLVRVTPEDNRLVIDVLANDNLIGHAVQDITLSIIMQPAQGTARVIPADTTAASGTAESRPRVEYIGAAAVSVGQEVQLYYTVAINGEVDTPPPAAVTILGAMSRPDQSLLDCSAGSTTVTGDVLTALSHADDVSQAVKLPFAVELFGTEYTEATVSSNGWVSFGNSTAAEPCTVATAWPGAPCLGSGPVLAVFWDDLVPDTVLTYHHKHLGAFVIQWTNVMFSGKSTPLGTFQAYIFQNGTVGYVYRDLLGEGESLGSGATIGMRGPTSNSAEFTSLMQQEQFTRVGSTADPHGSWYYAYALDLPDYLATAAVQTRALNPGLALVSKIGAKETSKPKEQVTQDHLSSAAKIQTTVPDVLHSNGEGLSSSSGLGSFAWWNITATISLPLLVPANSPPRPVIIQQPAARSAAGDHGQVLTVAWEMPGGAPAVEEFRLYVAADDQFAELLRQPAGNAFDRDISGGTRSVDIVLDRRYAGRDVYALLFACYDNVCSKSCTARLRPRPEESTSIQDALPRPSL